MYRYRAFGLTLDSEIAFTHFVKAKACHVRADLRIVRSSRNQGLSLTRLDLCYQVGKGECLFEVPEVGSYWIRNGDEIRIEAEADADPALLELFLADYALGYLLLQRGVPLFPAAALAINGQGLVLCGASSVGKTTLTAALLHRGHAFLSDDLAGTVEKDGQQQLLAGVPRLKLWESAFDLLELEKRGARIRPDVARLDFPLAEAGFDRVCPLHHFVKLSHWNGERVLLDELEGKEKMRLLHRSCFGNSKALAEMGVVAAHFSNLGAIHRQARVWLMKMPRGKAFLWEAVAKLEALGEE